MVKTFFLIGALFTAAAAPAETGPLPKDVIKSKQSGYVPTSVWLAEVEALFAEYLAARTEMEDAVIAGGYDNNAVADAIHKKTVPAAEKLADFCSAYEPDSNWGQALRQTLIDAMVSSLAADSHIIDILQSRVESTVPIAVVLAEQREISQSLIDDARERMRSAPQKYRAAPEKLAPSRDFYFQDFKRRSASK